MSPSETIYTPYDVLEVQEHKHINNQTTYLFTQWGTKILTKEQIDGCPKEDFQDKTYTQSHVHTANQPTKYNECLLGN